MKSGYLLIISTLLFGLFSCSDEEGINEVEITLDTVPFDRIQLESSADVRIIQADNFQVSMRGIRRDIDDIEVRVVNDKLTIEEHGNHSSDVVIKIFVPEIHELESSGSSQIYGESNFHQDRSMNIHLDGSGELDFAVETDDLDIEISGSAYVYLEGLVKNLDVELTGSGWLRSFNLENDFADVRITGSGSAEVHVITDLDAFISGSGAVYYKGHPQISASITGSGEVIDAN